MRLPTPFASQPTSGPGAALPRSAGRPGSAEGHPRGLPRYGQRAPRSQERPCAVARPDRDVAPARELGAVAGRPQLAARRARPAARSASRASRSSRRCSAAGRRRTGSRCRCRAAVEEALGPELVGVGVDRRVVMDQVGVRDEADAGRVGPSADLDRLLHEPRLAVRQDGAPAQRLLDRRGQVLVAVPSRSRRRARRARAGCARAARRPRRARWPWSRARRRAWSGARRAAPATTSASRPRGAPRAAWRARRRARRRRRGARRSARRSAGRPRPGGARSRRTGRRARAAWRAGPPGRGGIRLIGRSPKASIVAEAVAQGVEPRTRVEPEDRAQDDLERESLHARVERELAVARPARRPRARPPRSSGR